MNTVKNTARSVNPGLVDLIERLLTECAEYTVTPELVLGRCVRVWSRRDGFEASTSIDRFPGGGYRLRTVQGRGVYQFTEDAFTQQIDHDYEVEAEAKANADLDAIFGD
jgi:hypothetical protein